MPWPPNHSGGPVRGGTHPARARRRANGKRGPSWLIGYGPHASCEHLELLVEDPAALAERDAERGVLVPRTSDRRAAPRAARAESRSSVPSSLASSSGCRSGAMIAPATSRSALGRLGDRREQHDAARPGRTTAAGCREPRSRAGWPSRRRRRRPGRARRAR